jgi:hypothetical protein
VRQSSCFLQCLFDHGSGRRRLFGYDTMLAQDIVPGRNLSVHYRLRGMFYKPYHSVSAFGSSTGTLTGTSGICILVNLALLANARKDS